MLLLSPPKMLVIVVIALVVLGPDKLPSAARRVGALWSDLQRWRAHVEGEVRTAFPDLPSTADIARAVRSPASVLDRLADDHARETAPAASPSAAPAGAPPVPARQRGPAGQGPGHGTDPGFDAGTASLN